MPAGAGAVAGGCGGAIPPRNKALRSPRCPPVCLRASSFQSLNDRASHTSGWHDSSARVFMCHGAVCVTAAALTIGEVLAPAAETFSSSTKSSRSSCLAPGQVSAWDTAVLSLRFAT
eukprot:2688596-Rhodomonas_salina.1